MAIDETIKIGKEYWYYLIPENKPLNPTSWSVMQEPQRIKFNKRSSCGLIGIYEFETTPFDKGRIRIGFTDLYLTFEECKKQMLEDAKERINSIKELIPFAEKNLKRIKELTHE